MVAPGCPAFIHAVKPGMKGRRGMVDMAYNHPLHSGAKFARVLSTHAAGRSDLGRGNPKRGVFREFMGRVA